MLVATESEAHNQNSVAMCIMTSFGHFKGNKTEELSQVFDVRDEKLTERQYLWINNQRKANPLSRPSKHHPSHNTTQLEREQNSLFTPR